MDLPRTVRRVTMGYFLAIGLLGLGTGTWAVAGILAGRAMVIGRLWLAVAGFGTVLTVALLQVYYQRPTRTRSPSTGDERSRAHTEG
ncbi:MAG: hypothetical protein ABEJ67_05915 [Halanaeroarchaeum sp.]